MMIYPPTFTGCLKRMHVDEWRCAGYRIQLLDQSHQGQSFRVIQDVKERLLIVRIRRDVDPVIDK